MRIYHPQHGILFTTDQAEIDRLISTGGSEFDVNEKPWVKKQILIEAIESDVEEVVNPAYEITIPKRGRPAKHGNN